MKHYLGICLILVTLAAIGFFGLYSWTSAIDHTVDKVRDAFVQTLRVQPQVTVNQRVVMTQTAPIAELAVVTKEELVTIGSDEHLEVMSLTIPLTGKKLTVSAVFRLKAGFDLREPYSVEIDPASHEIKARLPRAKILSVEQVGDLTYKGDDAALNRITDDERSKMINDLNTAAHQAAETSSLKNDAEQQVAQRLQELLAHNGKSVLLEWSGDASKKSLSAP